MSLKPMYSFWYIETIHSWVLFTCFYDQKDTYCLEKTMENYFELTFEALSRGGAICINLWSALYISICLSIWTTLQVIANCIYDLYAPTLSTNLFLCYEVYKCRSVTILILSKERFLIFVNTAWLPKIKISWTEHLILLKEKLPQAFMQIEWMENEF